MAIVRVCDFHGKTVATSKNLRGVLRFATRHPVDVVLIEQVPGEDYRVTFYFAGGYSAVTSWASDTVCVDWLSRRCSWSIERITFIGRGLWERHDAMRNRKAFRGTSITWRAPSSGIMRF